MKHNVIPRLRASTGLATLALLFWFVQCPAQYNRPTSGVGGTLLIPQVVLIQPEALNHLLQGKEANRPLMLQVGSHVLYAEAHIPNSEYAGPGSQSTGLEALRKAVAKLSKDKFIVLYCGCCPWNRCPNLEPAYQQLQDMGFANVKVLHLADNFGANWVDKGYPVERGR